MRKLPLLTIVVLLSFACTRRVEFSSAVNTPSATALNINTATEEEMERLPHIGQKTAEAIVAFRERNGRFRRPEEIMLIRGFSEKRFLEIRPFISAE